MTTKASSLERKISGNRFRLCPPLGHPVRKRATKTQERKISGNRLRLTPPLGQLAGKRVTQKQEPDPAKVLRRKKGVSYRSYSLRRTQALGYAKLMKTEEKGYQVLYMGFIFTAATRGLATHSGFRKLRIHRKRRRQHKRKVAEPVLPVLCHDHTYSGGDLRYRPRHARDVMRRAIYLGKENKGRPRKTRKKRNKEKHSLNGNHEGEMECYLCRFPTKLCNRRTHHHKKDRNGNREHKGAKALSGAKRRLAERGHFVVCRDPDCQIESHHHPISNRRSKSKQDYDKREDFAASSEHAARHVPTQGCARQPILLGDFPVAIQEETKICTDSDSDFEEHELKCEELTTTNDNDRHCDEEVKVQHVKSDVPKPRREAKAHDESTDSKSAKPVKRQHLEILVGESLVNFKDIDDAQRFVNLVRNFPPKEVHSLYPHTEFGDRPEPIFKCTEVFYSSTEINDNIYTEARQHLNKIALRVLPEIVIDPHVMSVVPRAYNGTWFTSGRSREGYIGLCQSAGLTNTSGKVVYSPWITDALKANMAKFANPFTADGVQKQITSQLPSYLSAIRDQFPVIKLLLSKLSTTAEGQSIIDCSCGKFMNHVVIQAIKNRRTQSHNHKVDFRLGALCREVTIAPPTESRLNNVRSNLRSFGAASSRLLKATSTSATAVFASQETTIKIAAIALSSVAAYLSGTTSLLIPTTIWLWPSHVSRTQENQRDQDTTSSSTPTNEVGSRVTPSAWRCASFTRTIHPSMIYTRLLTFWRSYLTLREDFERWPLSKYVKWALRVELTLLIVGSKAFSKLVSGFRRTSYLGWLSILGYPVLFLERWLLSSLNSVRLPYDSIREIVTSL